ncbi:MAG: hypothetical protein ACJ75I_07320 [Solirubrobacterales bacterium]
MSLSAHGIALSLPNEWDGRIYGRARLVANPAEASLVPGFDGIEQGHLATLHAANFPLSGAEGEFAAEATVRMPAAGAFVALVEYQPDDRLVPGEGLFASREVPRALAPGDFRPETLMVPRGDQVGLQRFFTAGARPFCLYAVIGSRGAAARGSAAISDVLGSLVIV